GRAAARTRAAADTRVRAQTPPAPAARSGRRTSRTAPARPSPATSRPASWGGLPGHNADIVDEDLAQENHPGYAGEWPGDENERHGQFGQLRFLIPAELHEPDPPIDEHQREDQHEQVRDDPQHGVGAPGELGPDVDLEMRALLDADHRAEHDHPDEEKARQLLGPDVARNQLRIARDDLQRDRDDQRRDGRNHQPSQESAIAVDQLSHEREVRRINSYTVVPAKAGTHNHRLWNMGPRFRGDDKVMPRGARPI